MATEERASVQLDRVSKQFGDVPAVDELSLDLRKGEFFTLLGPSGCGKTTTLRMIAGFEKPSAGRVLIDGADVVDLPPYKRPTNTVFQSYALFPHLSVAENVAFGLKRKGVERGEISRRVAEELERVGLSREAGRRPSQLSGGQQQRVALARALVNLPKVLLLDEPLGALDLKLRKGLQVQLKRIQREVGIAFVYVTHDQEEALTMSDRIAVMNHGRIEQLGTPEDVYERPASAFVAGFVGVSNLIERDGQRFTIRPEKIRIHAADASTNGHPSVDGVVESSLYIGTATQVIVRLTDESPITVLVPNADEAERQRLPGGGAKVRLSWLSEHMHLIPESHEPEKEPSA